MKQIVMHKRMREERILRAPRLKTVSLPFEMKVDETIIANTTAINPNEGDLIAPRLFRTTDSITSGNSLGMTGLVY
jgi:hypothetical protein